MLVATPILTVHCSAHTIQAERPGHQAIAIFRMRILSPDNIATRVWYSIIRVIQLHL